MSSKVTQSEANHVVARVSGIVAGDTKVAAAIKAINTMKLAGFSQREIRKAERMLEQYRARTGE